MPTVELEIVGIFAFWFPIPPALLAFRPVCRSVNSSSRPSPLPLLTADEMRRWDERATGEMGIPERLLMESAGRAAARVLHRLYPRGRVAAAVGKGNNGGDAVVMLRCLHAWGREVVAVPAAGAGVADELCHGWKIPVASGTRGAQVFREAEVLVDGLLGTGAQGPPREAMADVIRALNAAGRPVVALDGPSGVDLTTGATPGDAVRADTTVCFGAPKRGLLLFPGRIHAGRLLVVEVGFPPLGAAEFGAALITPAWAHRVLPLLPPNAHKGTAGSVAVIAGRSGMGGAAIMVAAGALRAGAGMVRVVSSESNRLAVHSALPEAIFVERSGSEVEGALKASDAVVIGPGIGTDEEALALLRRILRDTTLPTLVDADALTLVARHPEIQGGGFGDRFLLTPHPGEMSRLLSIPAGQVVEDPFATVARAAERFGSAVLLKGSPSLIADRDGPVLANVSGHSGVATGGMGDTLAGVAGAMLASGLPPGKAAALAIFFAGRAAELAGLGRSLLPRDVAEALPAALAEEVVSPISELPDVLLDLAPPR